MSVEVLLARAKQRVPVVRQNEIAECGLACLAMVTQFHGYTVSLSVLRKRFSTSLRGMTFKSIIAAADTLGMSSRALHVPSAALGQIKLPAILHWDTNHFVVLVKASRKHFVVHDPARGQLKVSKEEFEEKYTGFALELRPDSRFQKKKEVEKLRLKDLWSTLDGLGLGLAQLLVLSVFIQLVVLINPLFLQVVLDEVVSNSNESLLIVLALGFAGLAIVNALVELTRNLVVTYLGSTLSFQIASNLFRHLLNLPLAYFEKRHVGDISSRFQSIGPIKKLLTEDMVSSLIDGLMVVTTLAAMFLYSATLAIVSLLSLCTYFVVRILFFGKVRGREEEAIKTEAETTSYFVESLRSVVPIKLFGFERGRLREWQHRYADEVNSDVRTQKLKIYFDSFSSCLLGLELVAVIFFAVGLIDAGSFTIGMLFAFLAFRTSFSSKGAILVDKLIDLKMVTLHLDRIADIVYSEPEEHSDLPDETFSSVEGSIELKNVSFRYSTDSPVILENVSFKVESGESIAIVGETGCGKSTLFKILVTLFTAESGDVLIDGSLLTSAMHRCYRNQIGVVMQDDTLLSGTIAENISLFAEDFDHQQLVQATKMAGVFEDIMAMPMKFDTHVGEMGSTLSGGQRQRMTLARALYRNPKILFVDEGTSNLDVRTENEILETLSSLNITRVSVAHRAETIRAADRIFKLKDKQLSEISKDLYFKEAQSSSANENEPIESSITLEKEIDFVGESIGEAHSASTP